MIAFAFLMAKMQGVAMNMRSWKLFVNIKKRKEVFIY